MACSILDNLKTDLRKNNLTNQNLEAPLSKEGALTRYVLNLTKVARKSFQVDMGNIFTIKKTAQHLLLLPNTPALEAIERSKEYELQQIRDRTAQKFSTQDKNQVVDDLSKMGQPVQNQTTPVQVKGLPDLEITC
jgi:hypothetical protein